MKILTCLTLILLSFAAYHGAIAQEAKVMMSTPHSGRISNIAWSHDGKRLATASWDTNAKIWDHSSGLLLHTLSGHTQFINAIVWSKDGRKIATGSLDGTCKIWDVLNGTLLLTLGPKINDAFQGVSSIAWSPIENKIIVASENGSAKIWNTDTGALLANLKGHNAAIFYAAWSPDGMRVSTTSKDQSAKIWNPISGDLLTDLLGHKSWVKSLRWSADGKKILTASYDGSAKVWNASDGKQILNISGHNGLVTSAEWSIDEKMILTASQDGNVRIWNAQNGILLNEILEGHKGEFNYAKWSSKGVILAQFAGHIKLIKDYSDKEYVEIPKDVEYSFVEWSPDGKYFLAGSANGQVRIFNETGKILKVMGETNSLPEIVSWSPDGSKNLIACIDGSNKIWDASKGIITQSFNESGVTYFASWSPNGENVAVGLYDGTFIIRDSDSGNQIHKINAHVEQIMIIAWSPDGTKIITGSRDKTAKIWNVKDGKLICTLIGHNDAISTVGWSPNGQRISTGSEDQMVKIWNISGTLIHTLEGNMFWIRKALWSPDGNKIAILSVGGKSIEIWDSTKGIHLKSLKSPDIIETFVWIDNNRINCLSGTTLISSWDLSKETMVTSASSELRNLKLLKPGWKNKDWSPDGNIVAALNQYSVIYTDVNHERELLSVTLVGDKDWLIKHSSGLFDASPGAMDKLYFVQGLDIIDFNQLKERYYEPGLWKKVMAGEELRNVEAFTKIELPPDIELSEVNAQGMLTIKVINRGGGIGKIRVLVNGKEVMEDARPKGSNSNAPDLTIQLPVTKFAAQFWPGEENYIAVKAWNAGHWVVSRGKMVTYKAPKKADIRPAIHVIACGISDYTGDELDLKFAAKDAEDVAQALTLGAKKLFGTEAAYVHTLTTSGGKETWPTKANIINTFKNVSSTAKSTDVIVLYLAGHGITWGGQDGDFYYLTQDAYTGVTSAYNDPAIREKTTLSSAELVELFKLIPAQKQVMIVDACGSGKAVDNLIAKRDIPSSTLRALDRMKDRTGMHIITGCAADAVSYEASQFGQGILTYSLLEGIRGAALRDEKFVDVNQLFQYAQERVPVLVAGVGGIQTPQVFSPYGAQSFDIGEVSTEDKKKIPIAKVRPVFVRSSLINKNTLDDNLQLGKLLDEKLNDIAARGTDAELIFVNVQDYPDGCKLSGIYEQAGDSYKADVKIKCGDKEQKQTITASSASDFVQKMVEVTKKQGQ